ncbi:hypothetical protein RJ45_03080 [Photobacterium gaetbulicola]|uniref:Uncharacterized protein n=1 Tax=Photobacterium gaetbulicola TaxID=1295392 RepID=A0A0B9GJT7_9GAMM|nr:hypothetical protein [Photobacterium gaetbulicola]KHT65060.1 hypothetical protein RJ45_03080 [Photobacterium gaetbulicola]
MYLKISKYINNLLLFCQFFVLGGLAFVMMSREHFEDIDKGAFDTSNLLMGSLFADIFVRSESVFLVAIFFILTICKEKILTSMKLKIMSNFSFLAILLLFSMSIVSALYSFNNYVIHNFS